MILLAVLPRMAAGQIAPEMAAKARADVEAAIRALDNAQSAKERVAALTEVIRGLEDGLAVVRQSLREARLRQGQLTTALGSKEQDLQRLLVALQAMAKFEGTQALAHPDGPVALARAGIIMADVAPGLATKANTLQDALQEAQVVATLQREGQRVLEAGLQAAQKARSELNASIATRSPLPRRFTADPAKLAKLIASSETLDSFAAGLDAVVTQVTDLPNPDENVQKGALPLPVNGRILRKMNEADAAGVQHPGIVIATQEGAIVTSPTAATLRYAGPFLDYGTVVILEPKADILFVFAGLSEVYGELGEVFAAQAPIGFMGGGQLDKPKIQNSQTGDSTGRLLSQTLYIEVRDNETPVDPLLWFAEK